MKNRNMSSQRQSSSSSSMMNPWQGISLLQNSIDHLFDDFLMGPTSGWRDSVINPEWGSFGFSPPMNVEENKDHYLMSFDLPGVKKENLKVELRGDQLVISGERRQETKENESGRHYYECSYGSFERSFTLPAGVTSENIETDFRDGVLSVAVPKVESKSAQSIPIGSGSERKGLTNRLTSNKERSKEKAA